MAQPDPIFEPWFPEDSDGPQGIPAQPSPGEADPDECWLFDESMGSLDAAAVSSQPPLPTASKAEETPNFVEDSWLDSFDGDVSPSTPDFGQVQVQSSTVVGSWSCPESKPIRLPLAWAKRALGAAIIGLLFVAAQQVWMSSGETAGSVSVDPLAPIRSLEHRVFLDGPDYPVPPVKSGLRVLSPIQRDGAILRSGFGSSSSGLAPSRPRARKVAPAPPAPPATNIHPPGERVRALAVLAAFEELLASPVQTHSVPEVHPTPHKGAKVPPERTLNLSIDDAACAYFALWGFDAPQPDLLWTPELAVSCPDETPREKLQRLGRWEKNETSLALCPIPTGLGFTGRESVLASVPSDPGPITHTVEILTAPDPSPIPRYGTLRRADESGRWLGSEPTMDLLDHPDRLSTPLVGAVRIRMQGGALFEGRLVAIGQHRAWIETGLGTMSLEGGRIHSLEKLDPTQLDPSQTRTRKHDYSGHKRVRVQAPGGVFVGRLLAQDADSVTLWADEGFKITLHGVQVEDILSGTLTKLRRRTVAEKD